MSPLKEAAFVTTDQLSLADYRRLATVIQNHSGIRMPDSKRTMVEGRLRRRLRALGMACFSDYCDFLFKQNGLDHEQRHLIDAVTTNKTEFFREPDHFAFLQREGMPRLLADRKGGTDKTIKIWSAASSTGAEPYSIAMLLADMAGSPQAFHFSVLGTDICTTVLEQAVTGVYPAEMMDPVPADMQRRYVMRSLDRKKDLVRMVPELRRLVRYQQLNLMDDHYPVDKDIDIIFCRNILIYFDKPTQHTVLRRLSRHLHPGGYLILGHSESMAGTNLDLHQVAPTIFRR
jgi:chemotaxis protein methyltransferase CheR